jgi:hypothetical protein
MRYQFFRSNQNANLRQVNLSNHCFSETSWLEVVDALQLNTSLERLDLDRCTFKAEAVKCFIQTFQPQKSTNKVKPVRQDNVLISLTSLEPDMFEGTAFTMVLAGVWSCSSPRNNRGRRPILKQKDASQVYTKSCFQIASIILCALDEAELDALSECLSHATHLRKLSISTIRNCGSRTVFESVVRAIRNNGSLHRVDLHSGTRDSERWPYFPLFDATQQRLIQAYCERNQAASSLLSASRLNDADGQCRDSALSLVAPVFVTANPAWRTAPNTFLVGLSAAADPTVLGPSHRVDKRILQRDTDIQS